MAKSTTRDMVTDLVRSVEEFYAREKPPQANWIYKNPRTQVEIAFNQDAVTAAAYLEEHIDLRIKNMSVMEMGKYLYENNVTVGCGHMAAVTPTLPLRYRALAQNVEHAARAGTRPPWKH